MSHFRVRTFGRAPSPPTWGCYEELNDDSRSPSPSGSECSSRSSLSNSDNTSESSDSETHERPVDHERRGNSPPPSDRGPQDEDGDNQKQNGKGKEKEIVESSPVEKKSRGRRREREPRPSTYRPILTTRISQGWVWNQELFVPHYMKDRYRCSISPSSSNMPIPTTFSAGMDFEVECVEIRVREEDIILP